MRFRRANSCPIGTASNEFGTSSVKSSLDNVYSWNFESQACGNCVVLSPSCDIGVIVAENGLKAKILVDKGPRRGMIVVQILESLVAPEAQVAARMAARWLPNAPRHSCQLSYARRVHHSLSEGLK